MAIGDRSRVQNQIDYQGGLAQNLLNNLRSQQGNQYGSIYNAWQRGIGQAEGGYGDIMNRLGNVQPDYGRPLAGYQAFAETGGFSPQDIQNIRARAIGPTRSIYSQAQSELERQRGLSGGLGANIPAAQAQLARQQSQAISDANVNANASIAGMQQQGRLAGLGGMTDIGTRQLQGQLAPLQAMTGLYGTSPGLAGTFGGQALGAGQQQLQSQGLQQDLMRAIISGQLGQAQLPSNFQSAMGNIGSVLGLGGQIGGSLMGLFGGGQNQNQSEGPYGGGYWGQGGLYPGPAQRY